MRVIKDAEEAINLTDNQVGALSGSSKPWKMHSRTSRPSSASKSDSRWGCALSQLTTSQTDYNKARALFFKFREQLTVQEQNELLFKRKTAPGSAASSDPREQVVNNAMTVDRQGEQIHDIQKTAN